LAVVMAKTAENTRTEQWAAQGQGRPQSIG
jgi:hypothetical protein